MRLSPKAGIWIVIPGVRGNSIALGEFAKKEYYLEKQS
jgi:hypothetical protein